MPLWVPLPLFSSPPGLFYALLAAARGSQKAVFFDEANPYKTCTGMYGSHIAPHPKEHRNRADIERFPKNTNIAPRAHPEL